MLLDSVAREFNIAFYHTFEHSSKAAQEKDSLAEYNLGLMYENGWGVEENDLEAAKMVSHSRGQRERCGAKDCTI